MLQPSAQPDAGSPALLQRLRLRGHTLRTFGYAAWWEPFDQITRRFAAWAQRQGLTRPYALVGHSLGNVIIRAVWPQLAPHPPQHVVMLAPPNQPPLLAQRLQGHPAYRHLTGTCGQRLIAACTTGTHGAVLPGVL